MRSAAPTAAPSPARSATPPALLRARTGPPGTTGCSTTSAMISATGTRFAGSALRRTNDRSSELRVEIRAPSASSSSTMRNVSRVVVPSSSRSRASAARPALPPDVGGVAGVHGERDVDDRRRVPLEQHHLQAVGQRRPLHRGKLHGRRVAERGQHLAIERASGPARASGTGAPSSCSAGRRASATRRGLHLRRRRRGQCLEPIEVGVGLAVVGQALGQDVGRARRSRRALDAADEVGERAALRALQFLGGRPLGEERRRRRRRSPARPPPDRRPASRSPGRSKMPASSLSNDAGADDWSPGSLS